MFRPKFKRSWYAIILLGIPLMYILSASVLLRSVNADIAFTKRELDGLYEYRRALQLYFELYDTKHPDLIIAQINALPDTYRLPAWQTAKDSFKALGPQPAIGQVASILRTTIQNIGDESSLILDPVLESYYLVDTLFNQIPLFLIWGTQSDYKNKPMPEVVQYYSGRIDHVMKTISAHHSNNNQLALSISALKQDWDTILMGMHTPATVDSRMEHVHALAFTSTETLRTILTARLEEYDQLRRSIFAIVVGFYAIISTLIIAAVRNYVNKREIQSAHQRKKLISQLAEKNEELEKFAYAAAHDLKEPIRTVRCFATLLKNESQKDLSESSANYISVIENAAQRSEEMINDLLGYTRLSEEELSITECDCLKELKAVLEDLESQIAIAKPDIHIGELPIIYTVPSMFRRIMLNVLDNALKYRRAGKKLKVRISAHKEKQYWVFSVSDNGIGLNKEHVDSVFEPFRRLYPALYQQGNGIGLTSCKKIVERLGGQIWIKPNPKHGVTVHFQLPKKSI